VVAGRLTTRWGQHEITHIEVRVRRADARPEHVDVEVDRGPHDAQITDTCLFGRLAERDITEIRLAVGVTSWLQPQARLGVQHQQQPFAIVVHHQGRPREVSVLTCAQQCIRVLGREGEHLGSQPPLVVTFEIGGLERRHELRRGRHSGLPSRTTAIGAGRPR
jgi:hypothetical protein